MCGQVRQLLACLEPAKQPVHFLQEEGGTAALAGGVGPGGLPPEPQQFAIPCPPDPRKDLKSGQCQQLPLHPEPWTQVCQFRPGRRPEPRVSGHGQTLLKKASTYQAGTLPHSRFQRLLTLMEQQVVSGPERGLLSPQERTEWPWTPFVVQDPCAPRRSRTPVYEKRGPKWCIASPGGPRRVQTYPGLGSTTRMPFSPDTGMPRTAIVGGRTRMARGQRLLRACPERGLEERGAIRGQGVFGICGAPPTTEPNEGIEEGIRDALRKLPAPSEVILQGNIDGLPLFKSSQVCFWPILCKVTNCGDSAPFIVSLFCGKGKPPCLESYLGPFLEEVQALTKDGLFFKGTNVPVTLSAMICDAPARSFVKRTIGHTGYYACELCTVRGVYMDGKVTYPHLTSPLRTDSSFRAQEDEHHHKGTSPFTCLDVDLVAFFPTDYMHLVCLGRSQSDEKRRMESPEVPPLHAVGVAKDHQDAPTCRLFASWESVRRSLAEPPPWLPPQHTCLLAGRRDAYVLLEAGAKVVCCLTRGAPKGPNLPRVRLNHQDALFPGHGLATHSQTWRSQSDEKRRMESPEVPPLHAVGVAKDHQDAPTCRLFASWESVRRSLAEPPPWLPPQHTCLLADANLQTPAFTDLYVARLASGGMLMIFVKPLVKDVTKLTHKDGKESSVPGAPPTTEPNKGVGHPSTRSRAEAVYCLARGAPKGPNIPRAQLNHQGPPFPGHGYATHSQTWVGEPTWLG
ncbi:hypothetical protein HPB47_027604, partial [Ixodes persulcatus]